MVLSPGPLTALAEVTCRSVVDGTANEHTPVPPMVTVRLPEPPVPGIGVLLLVTLSEYVHPEAVPASCTMVTDLSATSRVVCRCGPVLGSMVKDQLPDPMVGAAGAGLA